MIYDKNFIFLLKINKIRKIILRSITKLAHFCILLRPQKAKYCNALLLNPVNVLMRLKLISGVILDLTPG